MLFYWQTTFHDMDLCCLVYLCIRKVDILVIATVGQLDQLCYKYSHTKFCVVTCFLWSWVCVWEQDVIQNDTPIFQCQELYGNLWVPLRTFQSLKWMFYCVFSPAKCEENHFPASFAAESVCCFGPVRKYEGHLMVVWSCSSPAEFSDHLYIFIGEISIQTFIYFQHSFITKLSITLYGFLIQFPYQTYRFASDISHSMVTVLLF